MAIAKNKNKKLSIYVDANVYRNSITPSEYRGICIETNELLFRQQIVGDCTINLAEYFALVHAIMYTKKNKYYHNVFTDSKTALSWVRSGRIKTNLSFNSNSTHSRRFFERCKNIVSNELTVVDFSKCKFLGKNENNKIKKSLWNYCIVVK